MPIKQYPFKSLDPVSPARPYLPVVLRNPHNSSAKYQSWGLIDTGADNTVIPGNLARIIGHDLNKGKPKPVLTASGIATNYEHAFEIDILKIDKNGNVGNDVQLTIPSQQIAVSPGLHVILLGVHDFLGQYILSIDYPKQTFSISAPTK